MAVTKIWDVKSRLDHVLAYVTDPQKTEEQFYITGLNCTPGIEKDEMMLTKKQYQKLGGILAFHGYQSFAYGEVTPEAAHEIGVKLAKELWGDRFEVIVTTHLDKKHLHNHFVLNSVSFVDGKKYYDNHAAYGKMRSISDRLCREYQLSVITDTQTGRKYQSYDAYMANQDGKPTWHSEIISDLDRAIIGAMTMSQFYKKLKEFGYEWKPGAKYFTLRPPGKERFVRIDRKYPQYTLDNIRKRILEQKPTRLNIQQVQYKKLHLRSPRPKRKIGGFRGLYLHYCYLMGIFPKRKIDKKRLPFVLREDIRKMEQISQEARLLCKHHIDRPEQLAAYQKRLEVQIEELKKNRKQMYNRSRSLDCPQLLDLQRLEIQKITNKLSGLRKEVKLCNGIVLRSVELRKKLLLVKEDKNSRYQNNPQKERNRYEHVR